MAFPTTPLLDDFTRADGNIGGSWGGDFDSANVTILKIISNQVGQTGAGFGSSYWSAAQFGPDCECYVDISTAEATNENAFLLARLQTPNTAGVDGYGVATDKTNSHLDVYRIDNGSQTVLTTFTQTISSGDSVGFAVVGSQLQVWYKLAAGAWTLIGTFTDATYSGAGYIGVETRDTINRLDNFGGGTVVTASAASFVYPPIRGHHPQKFRPGSRMRRGTSLALTAPAVTLLILGQASETDLAQAISRLKTRLLGQPVETDLAQAVARLKTRALGQPAETDIAQPVSRVKQRVLGQPSEVELAQPITAISTRTLGQATETDLAQPFARVKTRILGQCTEADLAQPITRLGAHTLVLGQASETDSVFTIGRLKARSLGQCSDTELAQTITRRKTRLLGQPSETNTATSVLRLRFRLLGLTAETDAAQAVRRLKARTLGQTVELDEALAILPPNVAEMPATVITRSGPASGLHRASTGTSLTFSGPGSSETRTDPGSGVTRVSGSDGAHHSTLGG